MLRLVWKLNYKNIELLNYIKILKNKNKIIKILNCNIIIIFDLIGYIFIIYNGYDYKKVIIKLKMIFYKLGEFVFICKKFFFKGIKKKR